MPPNGNPQPGPKLDYKLTWLKRLNAHAADLYATAAPVALAGDSRVVPTDFDTLCKVAAAGSRSLDFVGYGWTDVKVYRDHGVA
jgi:exonuclease III